MFEKFIKENKEFFETVNEFNEDHFKDCLKIKELISFNRKAKKMGNQLFNEYYKMKSSIKVPKDMIYDADKSADWNRERLRNDIKKGGMLFEGYLNLRSKMFNAVDRMTINWIMSEWGYPKEYAEIVYSFASKRSCDLLEIINYINSYGALLKNVCEEIQEKNECSKEKISAEKKIDRWISFSEKLPEHKQQVFALVGNIALILRFNKENGALYEDSGSTSFSLKMFEAWFPAPESCEK